MIRAATVADARAIGALQLRAWLRAYEDIVDGSVLAGYDVAGRERQWVERLGGGDPSHTLVAEVGGRVSGFVTVGADRRPDLPAGVDDDQRANRGEVWAMYVDPPAQGAGLGGSLLTAGEVWLAEQGFAHAVLWVFRDNGHGRGFYEKHGWVHVDGSDRDDDWAIEVQYEKSL